MMRRSLLTPTDNEATPKDLPQKRCRRRNRLVSRNMTLLAILLIVCSYCFENVLVLATDATVDSNAERSQEDQHNQESHVPRQREIQVLHGSHLRSISKLLKDPMANDNENLQSPWLQEYLTFAPRTNFVLALMYSDKCAACSDLVEQFVHDIPLEYQQSLKDKSLLEELPPPVLLVFALEDVAADTKQQHTAQLEGFGITQVPALLWMMRDTSENTFVMDFVTTQALHNLRPVDILHTLQHVQSRLLLLSEATVYDEDTMEFLIEPRSFSMQRGIVNSTMTSKAEDAATTGDSSSSSELEAWISSNGRHIFAYTPQNFPGSLLGDEREYMYSLWYDVEDDAHDGFLLFGQCRQNRDKLTTVVLEGFVETFDWIAGKWLNKRDLVMVGISDCPDEDLDGGKVFVWRLFPKDLVNAQITLSSETAEKVISIHQSEEDAQSHFKNALVGATTPSVLWLEREVSAAIAFPSWRKVHAMLVIDVQRPASDGAATVELDQLQRRALQEFRQLCREHQRNQLTEDVVCLVVPSTDIRTLTVFGIDIWTPVNIAMSQPEDAPNPEILPVVLITDQRMGGTRRFYLDRDSIDKEDGLSTFWTNFWEDQLTPFPKSSEVSRTNNAGIRIITSQDFTAEVLRRDASVSNESEEARKHALILFTSSMCGHCRRLMTMWNQFGELVQTLGWSSFLTLYQMDVSVDEIFASDIWNETIRWVPDLVYVSPEDSPRTIRYAEEDEYGDNLVGGVKNYMDLVEWFLHTALLEDETIERLLFDVKKLLSKKKT